MTNNTIIPTSKLQSATKATTKSNLNNNTNMTLAEMLNKLQIGSMLEGTVSELTNNGNAIFTTKYGKFIIQNSNLKVGDNLLFYVANIGTERKLQLSKINNNQVINLNDNCNNILNYITEENLDIKPSHQCKSIVSIKKSLPQNHVLKTSVNYINLSKLVTDSTLYNLLKDVKIGTTIKFKILNNNLNISAKNYQINAEVINDHKQNTQLVKTVFGILSIQSNAIEIPSNTKLNIQITAINDIEVNIPEDTHNSESIAMDLLFKLNQNVLILQKIIQSIGCLSDTINDPNVLNETSTHNSSIGHNIAGASTLYKLINENKASLTELSSYFQQMHYEYMNNQWSVLPLPIFNNTQRNNKMLIKRLPTKTRFLINLSIPHVNEFQLDGLLHFINNERRIVDNFDLIIRFKNPIDNSISINATEIFSLYKNINGIGGNLSFEQTQEFYAQDH